jgi:NDP-sugar pyrophosphorylase family protein
VKCLILAREANYTWVKHYFPDITTCLLKIVNKPLLEFYVDFCSLMKISEIRFVTDFSSQDIEKFLEGGERWGVPISYNLARSEDTIDKILLKNNNFCKESDLLIIDDFVFLNYDKNNIEELVERFDNSISFDAGSIKFIKSNESLTKIQQITQDKSILPFAKINNVVEYYNLSMDILSNRKHHYVLPGYISEKNVFLGSNTEINRGVYIEPPILAGDNVRFRELTKIGPNAIFGDNVLIDSQTTVDNCIVYDYTYIGSELEISKMIVYKNNLISGNTGESIKMTNDFLVSGVEKRIIMSFMERLVQSFFTAILIILLFLPYMSMYLIKLYWEAKYPYKKEYFIKKNARIAKLPTMSQVPDSLLKRIFIFFNLDRYSLLFFVWRGQLRLVGNKLLDVQPKHLMLIKDLPDYQPGVFNYAETMKDVVSDEGGMHEGFYYAYHSFGMDMKILFRALCKRKV